MRVTINFYRDLRLRRVEVEHVRIDAVLTPEFRTDLLTLQALPQLLLGVGRIACDTDHRLADVLRSRFSRPSRRSAA